MRIRTTTQCARCLQSATHYVYEIGYRASGHFVCAKHISYFADMWHEVEEIVEVTA